MNDILKYRSHLMGVAILWVVFFHTQINVTGKITEFVWRTGYGGVDIFFFLSGIGVFYSLKKNSIKEFYIRRMKRIMPAYLPVVILTFILYNVRHWNGISFSAFVSWIKQIAGNVFMVGWMNQVEGQFNWYVQAVMWFYLAAPLFVTVIRELGDDRRKMGVFWSSLLLIQFPFMNTAIHKMPARILIFALGIYMIWQYEEKKKVCVPNGLLYLLTVVGIGILYFVYAYIPDWLEMYGLYWFPFVLIVPGLCMILCRGIAVLERYKIVAWLLKSLEHIGKASFEIYLIHILLFDFVLSTIGLKGNTEWILSAVLAIVAGILYKRAVSVLIKQMKLA